MAEYWLVFVAGVLGSFHCIGMCGGFPVIVSGAGKQGFMSKTVRQLLYNSGRIFTYFFLGVLAGALGFMIREIKPVLSFQVALSVTMGVVIIVAGLQIMGVLRESRIPGFTPIYKLLKDAMSAFVRRKGRLASFFLGLLNGFLPCPLIYGFLLVSLSKGTPHEGGLTMLALGLGTIPAMFLVAAVHGKFSPMMKAGLGRTVPGALMIVFGLVTVVRAVLTTSFGETIHQICGF
jgi:sulfite exporter TauE/SafE